VTKACSEPECDKRAVTGGQCRRHYKPLKTYPAEHLKLSEVKRLLKAAADAPRTGTRNVALLWVLWRTGLRISEALALRPYDIDYDEGTVFVRRGKGSKSRTIGIDDSAFLALRAWIAVRPESDYLFCTSSGKPVLTSYIRDLMARLGRDAGIQKRCHAHMLRHSLAVEMMKEGIGMEFIRRQLGHTSLAVTAQYLASLAPQETIDIVRKRKPPWEEDQDEPSAKARSRARRARKLQGR